MNDTRNELLQIIEETLAAAIAERSELEIAIRYQPKKSKKPIDILININASEDIDSELIDEILATPEEKLN